MNVRAANPLDAGLALLASLAALASMSRLLAGSSWVRPALVVAVVVVLVGVLARILVRSAAAVAAVQTLAAVEAIALIHGRGHLWHGLPTVDTIFAFNNILFQARLTVMAYAAPAPMNRGLLLATTILVAVVVLLVDVIAVTRKAPAAAGLPLLAAYLVTATNSGEPLPWLTFALPAGLWLVLLSRSAIGGLRRWATAVPLVSGGARRGRPRDPADSFGAGAVRFGVVVIAVALLVPMTIPHLPTRFLGEGLGRTGSGGSSGSYELSSTLDLTRDLVGQSDQVVLRYRTSDPAPEPLRLAVLRRYDDAGQFHLQTSAPSYPVVNGRPLAGVTPIPAEVKPADVRRYTMSVLKSQIRNPQLPLPMGVDTLDLPDGVIGTEFADRVVTVNKRVQRYDLGFTRYSPPQELFQRSDDAIDGPGTDIVTSEDFFVENRAFAMLDQLMAQVIPDDATDLEAAVAIQDYLRGPEFTYSLTLAQPPTDSSGMTLDPISSFLASKRGYCQQFATAMIMMARLRGIPARMVIGFLPGDLQAGERVVRGRDAHAWPELFFPNVGWLRFEPTPASRAGAVPLHARITDEASPQAPSTSPSTSTSSTTAAGRQPGAEDLGAAPTTLDRPVWQRVGSLPAWLWGLLAAGVGLGASLLLPVIAARQRRRRYRGATDDAARVEAQWFDLVHRIGDLGIPVPPSLTPRQTRDFVQERGALGPGPTQALGRVVHVVELARYAPPSVDLGDPRQDVHRVLAAVGESRSWRARARAWFAPSEGVRTVSAIADRIGSAPGRAARGLRALPPRR